MSTLFHPAPRPLPGGNPLLILLHGFGSHEGDLFGLANYLDDRLSVAALRAPIALPQGGFAWFNLEITPQGMKRDLKQAHATLDALAPQIRALAEHHKASQIFLGGFSQGAIISAALALRMPALARGLVLMSGRLLEPANAVPGLPPAIMVHGTQDQVIPIADGRAFSTALQAAGMRVDYHEYAMAHTISEDSLEAVNTWLAARI